MLERAIKIATSAHEGQKDKAGHPYILHPLRVMLAGKTKEQMIVGVLHDVVEDTNVTIDDLIGEGFSKEVVDAVSAMTHERSVPYMDYIEIIADNDIAVAVKLHDLVDNLNRTRIPNFGPEDEKRCQKYLKAKARLEGVAKQREILY